MLAYQVGEMNVSTQPSEPKAVQKNSTLSKCANLPSKSPSVFSQLLYVLSQVLVFRCGEQIELSFSQQREVIERGINRIIR